MTSFADTWKKEVARVAKKEMRNEIVSLRKAVAAHRTELAAVKRQLHDLQVGLRTAKRAVAKAAPALEPQMKTAREKKVNLFDAKEFAATRQRLGLTQAEMATVLGSSSLSVYKWEKGNVTPRAKQLETIARVSKMSKLAAKRALEAAS
ncbi:MULTISPECIES: helix-turn-helix domain-containing protein [unclassified Hydrogenophaga]|jgi:DNA-binding transcriptional regulator YiaG|uniref:helix-turn-helix domain-containing protein n=1 Tax=unclassified Hydrogenophaga TaxID=2610897 RepID=UPI00131FE940|nr:MULTISPECIES: helix-turn-helix domain-containing protein [unclassified Hydrogenophaga]MDP3350304.1 helix-turn-helix domain-containing protein [Hydrogenophaga sp.]QHE78771.1 helix-turn-helix domain-containing protein [Hydrogenophaga sp. PBL-H3]QHE83196.1 helix-turn-helix domain-containing protein [Hydrogenophaga sp. PBL-H3]